MNIPIWASIIAIGLFFGMLFMLECGRRIGLRKTKDTKKAPAGIGAVEGAVFALLGLLIAFTFSGAIERLNFRRDLIVEEANNIGTAWLRIDLLPSNVQPEMRKLFRNYLNSRLEFYRKIRDTSAASAELKRSMEYQSQIWTLAQSSCQSQPAPCSMLLLPSLNQMFDITTTRTMAMTFHPPTIVFVMLIVLALGAALFAGYGMSDGERSWLHTIGFAIVMAVTVYVILDIEYPRFGFIRIDAVDQVLRDLLKSMQ